MLTNEWYVGKVIRKGKRPSFLSRTYTGAQWWGGSLCLGFFALGLYVFALSFKGGWFMPWTIFGVGAMLMAVWLFRGVLKGVVR